MGNSPSIPLPGMGNDVTGSQINPTDLLRQIYMQRQPMPMTQGTISAGPAMPQPQTALHQMPVPQGGGVPQGEFQTKGAHQRASMQSLATTLQATVAQANNALQQHEQKILTQKTDAYTHAVQGIAEAEEMLKSDPTSMEALQMKQRNTDFLNAFLDPTTPEGKKNIKLLEKAYAVQNEEKTPEQIAAQSSAKKVRQQADLAAMAERLKSGSAFPETAGPSPLSQIHGEMIKQGLMPKAATGTAILNNQTQSAKALTTDEQKQQQFSIQRERLGLDEKGNPLPLDKLPLTQRAKVESERATDQLKDAQAQLAKARAQVLTDPNSPQNQVAFLKARSYQGIASALLLRARVGLLNYDMRALGTGPDGKPLPGVQVFGGQPIGSQFASLADKVMSQQAQFLDIDSGLDSVDAASRALHAAGGSLNDPRIIKLLSDHHVRDTGNMAAFNNWIDSSAVGTLSPEQRDYLISVKQSRERVQGLRKLVGQGISNQQIDTLLKTIPGTDTADFDYAQRQLKQARGLVGNLRTAIPKLNLPGQGGSSSAPIPPDKLTNDLNEALKF